MRELPALQCLTSRLFETWRANLARDSCSFGVFVGPQHTFKMLDGVVRVYAQEGGGLAVSTSICLATMFTCVDRQFLWVIAAL